VENDLRTSKALCTEAIALCTKAIAHMPQMFIFMVVKKEMGQKGEQR